MDTDEYPHLVQGIQLAKEGNFPAALEVLNRLTANNPENDMAWVAKGKVLANLGKNMDAYQAFNTALKVNPDNKSAKTNLDIVVQYINEEIPMPEPLNRVTAPTLQIKSKDEIKEIMSTQLIKKMTYSGREWIYYTFKLLSGVPWPQLLSAAVLGGLAVGFIVYPLLAGMILGWDFIMMLTYMVGSCLLALPLAWLGGRIWKPVQNREKYEGIFSIILILVCAFFVIRAIAYSAGIW